MWGGGRDGRTREGREEGRGEEGRERETWEAVVLKQQSEREREREKAFFAFCDSSSESLESSDSDKSNPLFSSSLEIPNFHFDVCNDTSFHPTAKALGDTRRRFTQRISDE